MALNLLKDGYSSLWFSNWSEIWKLVEHVLYVYIQYTNITTVVCDHLKVLPICLDSLVTDRLTWKGNLGGIHTTRDDYN